MLLAVFLTCFWGGFVGVGRNVLGVCLVLVRLTAGGVDWFCGGLAYLRMGMAGNAKSAVRTMCRDEKKALFFEWVGHIANPWRDGERRASAVVLFVLRRVCRAVGECVVTNNGESMVVPSFAVDISGSRW